MKVRRVGLGLRRTAVEPMTCDIQFADHTGLLIRNVNIPETDVHRQYLFHWLVDACVGSGQDEGGNRVEVRLPAEPVVLDLTDLCMVAKEITAPVTVTLADGSVGLGSVVFPDCRTDLLTGIAESVTATGTITIT